MKKCERNEKRKLESEKQGGHKLANRPAPDLNAPFSYDNTWDAAQYLGLVFSLGGSIIIFCCNNGPVIPQSFFASEQATALLM